jgi:FKBP-type peptidyl-prolyl cis-trans isomerase 2
MTARPYASVDFNHPLAGKHLVIDVKILNVAFPDGKDGRQLGHVNSGEDVLI